jgi:exodeoxyribonuclease V gamma subunit
VAANWSRGPTTTWLFGEGAPSVIRFGPVSNAAELLSEWLGWLQRSRQRPIPLFVRASRVYAEGLVAGSSSEALAKARREFESAGHGNRLAGESCDPYVELVMRGRDPLDAEFETCSRRLFGALFAHRREGA